MLGWWAWPASEAPAVDAPVAKQAVKKRVMERFTNAAVPLRDDSDGLFAEAASGELGDEMQAKVCELCRSGMIDPDACQLCEPERVSGGILVVDVVDEEGRPAEGARVWLQGCEHEQRGWREYVVIDGTCQVFAGRRDGALWAQAEPASAAVPDGEERYVQLELPSTRTGGLGVSVKADAEGVRVLAVMPGTPAAEMGLEPGDLIVEVDGLDTRGLELMDFIRTMTGPENTEVDFVVQFESDTGITEEALTIVRRYIEPSG